MDDERFARLGPALAQVGQTAMRIVGGQPDNVYLYVEIGEGWVDISLYRDEGNALRWFDPSDSGLSSALIDAWYLEPEDKRWTGMEYTIDDGKFDAKFQFDDLDAYEGLDDRRQQFLHARFGDKPQLYPPLGGGWDLMPPL